MKIKIIVSLLLIMFVLPLIVSAQPNNYVTEQCCKVGADVTMTTGKLNGTDCTETSRCVFVKGTLIGPESDTTCSLKSGLPAGAAGGAGKIDSYADGWTMVCLLGTIYAATNWVFIIMMAFAVILVVIGGATYMLAVGDPDKASKGKSIITLSMIGLAIALVARFVPYVVRFVMGVN